MSKIYLAKTGIFPILFDADGKRIAELSTTGLPLPGTIQGEGRLVGVPSLFVRLAGCNLSCHWKLEDGSISACDTPHASLDTSDREQWEINDIITTLRHNLHNINHVVVTGGEPFIQPKPLKMLCKAIKEELSCHVSIETNGTTSDDEVLPWIDFFSISPKLKNAMQYSCHRPDKRLNIMSIQKIIDHCKETGKDFQLKFVVADSSEDREIKEDFLNRLRGWTDRDIYVMPLGSTEAELAQSFKKAFMLAVENNWQYCPRVHVSLFGDAEGV
ncbi:MAG: 7-carboxy-7-deazaguanine synthase QueE [Bacteroidales bacterium]